MRTPQSWLLLLVLCVVARPANADVAVGTSAGNFLGFEIGAGSSGLAGAQTSIATGASAQYWNPGLLADLSQPQASLMHATWLEDLQFEWIGYARPVSPKLGVGSLSIAYFHMPSISGVDQFDNPTGEFRVYDMAVTAGLARPVGKGINAGVNVKMIRQNLATVAATGFATDLGVATHFRGTSFGATVQNLGPGLSFGGASYALPRQVRFGVGRELMSHRLLLAADYNMPKDYYRDVRFGVEARPHPMVALRLGYRHEFGSSGDPANGPSYGLGVHSGPVNVDYSMTPDDQFADVHRLSFGYTFGGSEGKPEPKKPEPKQEPARPQPAAPKGPPVIASVSPAAKPVAPAPAAAPKPAPAAKPAAAATALAQAPVPVAKSSPVYEVVLGRYQSQESAQSELKALQILGFNVKDARLTFVAGEGYRLCLARLGSRKSADDLASSLEKLSFQPKVEVANR